MSDRHATPEPVSSHAPGAIDRELDTRKILLIGAGLAIVTVAAIAVMAVLFRVLLAEEVRRDPIPAPLAAEARAQKAPEPRLQVTPEGDLVAMRKAEARVLTSFAWVNRDSGRVRIPIERAMAIIAAEGLPVREEAR
ncbi:MAG TPA: hypothetical protein VID50_02270 [Candidatus Eisenbacteria bacterium]